MVVSHSFLFTNSLLANQHSGGMIREVRKSYTNPTKRKVNAFRPSLDAVFKEFASLGASWLRKTTAWLWDARPLFCIDRSGRDATSVPSTIILWSHDHRR
jgi:hypothetical protein